MGFVVKIIPKNMHDIEGYYAGKMLYYHVESCVMPSHTDDLHLGKVYKYRKTAENAVKKILRDSTYVTECRINEV